MTIRAALRHPFAPLYIAAAGIVLAFTAQGIAVAAGASPFLAPPAAPAATTAPDMTMAECTLWEDGNTPTLPPYTYTDRCWDATNNTVAYADPAKH